MTLINHFLPATRYPLPALAGLLLIGASFAQSQDAPVSKDAASKDVPGESTPTNTTKVGDLTARYRFSERYTEDDARTAPGIVGSYRVATRDEVHESIESAQGAPRRTDATRQLIYAERASAMGVGSTSVFSTVRAIERFQTKPEDASRTMGARPLDQAVVLIRPRSNESPLVLSLTEGRSLTEFEYDTLVHQPYVPNLSQLLPVQAVRLGDGWRVPRKAAQALLGDWNLQADTLNGKLSEVRREVDGPRMVASVAISGKIAAFGGETAVNAVVLFTFVSPPAPKTSTKKSFPPQPYEDLTEARGAVTEVRMACVTNGPVPGTDRLRFLAKRSLTLQRQLGAGPGATLLPTLEKQPESNEANSWLNRLDASGRYSFLHPQDMLPADASTQGKPGSTILSRAGRENRDMLQVEFFPRTLAVEDLKKAMAEKYALMKMEKIEGDQSWLPETEWPGVRVHRIDAALKVAETKGSVKKGAIRIHFDGYLIQFPQSASILAIATTSRESAGSYRGEVEAILKTIKVDPPRPKAG